MVTTTAQKHILVVEDEKALSHALDIKLNDAGYAIDIASDGKEALNMVQRQTYDIIVLDIIMPRMDGFTLLEILKTAGKTYSMIPVLVLSNLGQEEEIERAKELGATEYLVKADSPFPKIMKTIEAILSV